MKQLNSETGCWRNQRQGPKSVGTQSGLVYCFKATGHSAANSARNAKRVCVALGCEIPDENFGADPDIVAFSW